MDRLFDALGDGSRRRILELLAAGEQPVVAIVSAMQAQGPISQPAISQHLKVLRAAGLVTVRAEGTRRLYAIDARGLSEAQGWLGWLADPVAPFEQPLDALATEVARGQRARRQGLAQQGSGQQGSGRRRSGERDSGPEDARTSEGGASRSA